MGGEGKMAKTIVVTLQSKQYSQDFELPATVPLHELYPRLTEALHKAAGTQFQDFSSVILEKDGAGLLDEAASLADYGVCDGCILNVVRKEKYNGFRER